MFIDLTYARFKQIKLANPTTQIYYLQTGAFPNPVGYQAILGDTDQFICYIQDAADVADFVANFLAAGIVVSSTYDGISHVAPIIRTGTLQTGSLTTTTSTANQVVLTYTIPAGITLYLGMVHLMGHLSVTPGSANPINLGTMSLESPAGTKLFTVDLAHPDFRGILLPLPEPFPIPSGTVLRMVCTPAAATSTLWRVNFGGFGR